MDHKRMKALRLQRGLTQQELASILKFSNQQRYNYYETGKREPDNDTLKQIAMFFDVSTDYLLGATDDPAPSRIAPSGFVPDNGDHDDNDNDRSDDNEDFPVSTHKSDLNNDGSAYIYVMGYNGEDMRILVPADKIAMIKRMIVAAVEEDEEDTSDI